MDDVPSMLTDVLTPRWPDRATVSRLVSISEPGVSSVKSLKSRPRIGSESMASSVTVVDTWVFEVSMTGASPVTIRTSSTRASGIEKLTPTAAPRLTVISVRSTVWKPGSSARTT